MTPDLFNCRPLASVLSRSACGARHERRIGKTCETCAVGRQHARGALPTQWPDGAALTTAAVTVATMAQLKIHLAVIASYERPPARGHRIQGETLREHAERAGVDAAALRTRLWRGQSLEAALDPAPRQNDPRRGVVRALARQVGMNPGHVSRLLRQGLTAQTIAARAARRSE